MDIILILVIVTVLVVIFAGIAIGIYNSLVRADVKAKEAWSGITV
ncbi:LemA family protein, partial [Candidatus Saccharibacteria bacterium]|nr:LemA family protein [Candidatus Saccharibacteria bacterium]